MLLRSHIIFGAFRNEDETTQHEKSEQQQATPQEKLHVLEKTNSEFANRVYLAAGIYERRVHWRNRQNIISRELNGLEPTELK
jgi:hypothetical protein